MIKNILVAAAFGAAAMGAHAASDLLVNSNLDGSTGSYIYNGAPASVTANYGSVPTFAGTVSGWDGSFVSIAGSSGAWSTPAAMAHHNLISAGWVAGVQADGVLSQDVTLAAGTYALNWVDANRGADQSYAVAFTGGALTSSYLTTDLFSTTNSDGWQVEHLLFTTTGGTGTLSFTGGTTYGSGAGRSDSTSLIDNVTLSAVPEPTSLLMMSLATLGLLAWRRRAQV